MKEYRALLIGDTGVGKDSILDRLIDNTTYQTISTIGVSFRVRYYPNAKISFWNTGGQKRYLDIIKRYFRNIDAVIIVYDSSSQKSFENCKFWLNYFRTNEEPSKHAKIYILGNKIDLLSNFSAHEEILKLYAKSENIQRF